MKKAILGALMWALAGLALAGPNSIIVTQRNSADTGNAARTLDNPPSDGLLIWNHATKLPSYLTVGAGLVASNGVLAANIPAQVNPDWNATTGAAQILNKPTLKTVAMTGEATDLTGLAPLALTAAWADVVGKPALFSGDWSDLTGRPTFSPVAISGSYVDLQGRPAFAAVAISGSYNDLTDKPTTTYTFNFGVPAARTIVLSTAYQAINPAKAATVTVSPSCSASLSLAGGSTCLLQARIGVAPLTCASGAVVANWTNGNTGALTIGLALNQVVGAPYGINLPIGASFILCPVSGTFTISAAEQSVG